MASSRLFLIQSHLPDLSGGFNEQVYLLHPVDFGWVISFNVRLKFSRLAPILNKERLLP